MKIWGKTQNYLGFLSAHPIKSCKCPHFPSKHNCSLKPLLCLVTNSPQEWKPTLLINLHIIGILGTIRRVLALWHLKVNRSGWLWLLRNKVIPLSPILERITAAPMELIRSSACGRSNPSFIKTNQHIGMGWIFPVFPCAPKCSQSVWNGIGCTQCPFNSAFLLTLISGA